MLPLLCPTGTPGARLHFVCAHSEAYTNKPVHQHHKLPLLGRRGLLDALGLVNLAFTTTAKIPIQHRLESVEHK